MTNFKAWLKKPSVFGVFMGYAGFRPLTNGEVFLNFFLIFILGFVLGNSIPKF